MLLCRAAKSGASDFQEVEIYLKIILKSFFLQQLALSVIATGKSE